MPNDTTCKRIKHTQSQIRIINLFQHFISETQTKAKTYGARDQKSVNEEKEGIRNCKGGVEEELELDTDIEIMNATSKVLWKFELNSELNNSIASDHRETEEVTARRFLPKPSLRVLSACEEAKLDSELSI